MDRATKTDWSFRAILAGGVATDDGGRGELEDSSTAATSTRKPAAADDSESEGDRAASRSAASTEQSAAASGQPEGLLVGVQVAPGDVASSDDGDTEVPPISVEVVPNDVVSSDSGDATRNNSDLGDSEAAPAELREDTDEVEINPNENEVVSFLTSVLAPRVDDSDDVVNDAVLTGQDNRGYHGVPNDVENLPANSASTPTTRTPAADHVANTMSSTIEHDRTLSMEMPTNDHGGNFGPSNADGEELEAASWQEQDDESATSSMALNGDSAFKLLEQIVNNRSVISDTNTDSIRTDNSQAHVNLIRQDTNRTQSNDEETSSRKFDRQISAGPDLEQPESTIIAVTSPATFPHPDNEKASTLEPTSQNEQIAFASSDRYNAWSSKADTTTAKPKPGTDARNGNSVSACCDGRLVCLFIIQLLSLIANIRVSLKIKFLLLHTT